MSHLELTNYYPESDFLRFAIDPSQCALAIGQDVGNLVITELLIDDWRQAGGLTGSFGYVRGSAEVAGAPHSLSMMVKFPGAIQKALGYLRHTEPNVRADITISERPAAA